MKVAFDHQIFLQEYGGISRYFVELAKNIPKVSEDKSHVNIIAPLYTNEYLACSLEQVSAWGMRVPNIPGTKRIIRKANEQISSVVLNQFRPGLIHETYYAKKVLGPEGTKRVITVYDMIHELFPQFFPKSDRTSQIKKIAIDRADHVICISENTRNDLVNILGVDRNRTSVIYLGFALSATKESFLKQRKPFLLYVGSRGGYKNFEGLVKAYANSPRLVDYVDLVCFGGGSFKADELSLLEKLKLPEGCTSQVTGGDELLAQYYGNATLFVYPSLYEGFGIPPLEAMSYGCAVACSNTSSMPEVVDDSAVLFDPHSSDSMVCALEKIVFDSEERETLVANGYQRIQRFSWKKCTKETYDVYKKVLKCEL
ncbi:MAG: glycosyltransferase involved in cell wall biosynthesis [Planctomycetota bacterium]|jgi:glycosyltransferase involved in cell wall biosynthesis